MSIAGNNLVGARGDFVSARGDFERAESRARSFAKGLTWRVVATLTTIAIVWIITSDIQLAVEIGAIEVVAKVAVYYAHERAWVHIPFGRAP